MTIFRVSPFRQPEIVKAIAAIYREAFGGDPWYEGYACPVCEKIFPLAISVKICPVCAEQSRSVLLVACWPTSKVVSDFYREMAKSDAVCVVAQDGERIVGFAWGYNVSVDDRDFRAYLEAPNLSFVPWSQLFFYLDECALLPDFRGKGVGRRLLATILYEQQKSPQVLLRTMKNSRMFNLTVHMGGKVLQDISGGRVIMELFIRELMIKRDMTLPLEDPPRGWSSEPLGIRSGH